MFSQARECLKDKPVSVLATAEKPRQCMRWAGKFSSWWPLLGVHLPGR